MRCTHALVPMHYRAAPSESAAPLGDGMLSEILREMGMSVEAKRAEQLEEAVADLADRLGMVRFALAAACSVLDGASEPDHLDDHPGGPVGQAAV